MVLSHKFERFASKYSANKITNTFHTVMNGGRKRLKIIQQVITSYSCNEQAWANRSEVLVDYFSDHTDGASGLRVVKVIY